MPSSTVFNILEACRESGCPICRLEQKSVERYLDHHFYENVNSPKWRDHLRGSLGFCHEHAWLGVSQRLGDALGYSIIYRDLVNSVLRQWDENSDPPQSARQTSTRTRIEKMLAIFAPRKRCPVCEHREHATHTLIKTLVEELGSPQMTQALQASEGLCMPHLQLTFENIKDHSVLDALLNIHRAKLEGLRTELEEFIRKNDYQAAKEGFGKEGDAWLRAIGMVVGKKKK